MRPLLDLILGTDHTTRGLGDAEARLMVDWLVEQAEACHARDPEQAHPQMVRLCARARALARFVSLWCYERNHGAACQLAATERFPWPLPTSAVDPWELLSDILTWESERTDQAA
jgi:hypothetical protein